MLNLAKPKYRSEGVKHSPQKVQVWLLWLFAVLATTIVPLRFEIYPAGVEVSQTLKAGTGVVIAEETPRKLFPWLANYRWRKLAIRAYRRWRRAYRQAKYRYLVARGLARLAGEGILTLAWVMDLLTRQQMRYYLGALPLLYTILDDLKVWHRSNWHKCSIYKIGESK